jgi:oxalate decarboxylase/phosphoglucose isomerase-like protein (cupin superfamily)
MSSKQVKIVLMFLLNLILTSSITQSTVLSERSKFKRSDFIFDLNGSPIETPLTGGNQVQRVQVGTMPALIGAGVSYTLFHIEPCGINMPHVHPRANELFYVIEGKNIQVGFVEENNGRTIVNNINKGYVTLFPQGLVHFEQNLSCEPAIFLSALSHEDPGLFLSRLFTVSYLYQ